ncbi:hypothetical protein [Kribbella solani]|uniref:Uncharacterized protein n=1 Tax=Kribbella solani TaxID=236067 RepID=A0A841E0F1_9ACTN|nr:hypothetical protein [Kribbella solani]MBB5982516.1 hypothetical protein [Kribbella solani]
MNLISATASRRSPWQNPRRLRQVAAGVGVLLLGYLVLVLVALLGGPRIGAGFLPLPGGGGGPEPVSPVAGLQAGQPTENLPRIPHTPTPTPAPSMLPVATPGVLPSAVPTQLPGATTPGTRPADAATTPTPEIVESKEPTIPVVTATPPVVPPTQPTSGPDSPRPTAQPTDSTTTPTVTPTTPSTPPSRPDHGGFLAKLLRKLGL